jgi:hypothetical protein
MSETSNKEKAIDFYKMAYNGNPKKAVELYVGNIIFNTILLLAMVQNLLLLILKRCTMNIQINR